MLLFVPMSKQIFIRTWRTARPKWVVTNTVPFLFKKVSLQMCFYFYVQAHLCKMLFKMWVSHFKNNGMMFVLFEKITNKTTLNRMDLLIEHT